MKGMTQAKGKTSRFVRWVAWGISFIFFWGLLEIAGLIYVNLPSTKTIEGYGYPNNLFVTKPDVGHGYLPGFRGYFEGEDMYRTIPIHINQRGFRDKEFSPKSPSRKRLVVLGDSVVFGSGVRYEARFTQQLEKITQNTTSPLEVLNLGVNSWSYWHYMQLMDSPDVHELQPDILMIAFTLDDIRSPVSRHWWEKLRRRFESLYSIELIKRLTQRIQLFFISTTAKEEYSTVWMRSVLELWQDPRLQKNLRENLHKSRTLTQKWGVPLLVVVAPEANDLKHPETFSLARMQVRKYLDETDITYCDLYKAFASLDNIESWFLPRDSIHFSAKGHRFAAEQIAFCLNEQILSSAP